jgi:hypothetical protein
LIVFEFFAGRGKERINGGFVNHRAFLKAFALNGPVATRSGAGHEVNTGIFSAEIAAGGKFVPEPYVGKEVGIARVSLQIGLYEPLEFIAFIAFGEGGFAVMGERGLEWGMGHF